MRSWHVLALKAFETFWALKQVRHSHYFAVTHQDRKTTAIHTLANAHWQSNLQFIGGSLTFPNLHLVCIFELEC